MATEASSADREALRTRLQEQLIALVRRLRAELKAQNDTDIGDADIDRVRVLDVNPPQFSVSFRMLGDPVTVLIPLVADAAELRPRCDRCRGACRHCLQAVLELLSAVEGGEREEEVLEAVSRRPWERFLETFDAALDAAENESAQRRAVRFWWRVDREKLRLEPWVERPTKDGRGHLKPKRIRLDDVEGETELVDADRRALAAARVLHAERRAAARDGRERPAFLRALLHLVGHPRVSLDAPGGRPWSVLRLQPRLHVERRDGWVDLALRAGNRELGPNDAREARLGPLLFDDRPFHLELLEVPPPLAKILDGWARGAVAVPEARAPELMARLSRASVHLAVEAEDVVRERVVETHLDLVALLTPLPHGLHVELKVCPLPGGPLLAPGLGVEAVLTSTPDRQILRGQRDLDAEHSTALEAAASVGLDVHQTTGPAWQYAVSSLGEAFETIDALERSAIACQWPGIRWNAPTAIEARQVQLRIDQPLDLLGLNGHVELDGRRVALAVLVEAARRDRGYLSLADGNTARLQEALRQRLEALARFAEPREDGVEVPLAGLEAVQALAEATTSTLSPRFAALEAGMAEAASLDPEIPSGLKGELRPYQLQGFRWMARLAAWRAGCVLADDMGLGKTIQTIAMLLRRSAEGPQLVVAPTSVTFNWRRELRRFAPELTVRDYTGPRRKLSFEPGTVMVTSYGVVLRDAPRLAEHELATLVLDEAQAIKNARTARSRAIRSLRAQWTVALTGTPMENHPAELWALFSAVFPALLGSWEHFRSHFMPDEEARTNYREGPYADRPEPSPMTTLREGPGEAPTVATGALRRAIQPYVLRRTKDAVAQELPPRTEVQVDVTLSHRERALYDDARLAAIADLEKHETVEQTNLHIRVFTALTRLRQLACHPRLVDPDSRVPSAKLERLMQIVEDLRREGRRALVFSQFVRHLALVREALDVRYVPYAYLDGTTPPEGRARAVDAFQSGDTPLFLISLKAGGTGLNLTAADTVIHLDPWWNPAVEDQATDRAHRLGQTKPVTVLRLVARDTLEPAMLRMNKRKRAMMADLLGGTDAVGRLSAEELVELIRKG